MQLFTQFVDQWWLAIFLVFCTVVALVGGVQYVRAQNYEYGVRCLVSAELVFPYLLILGTPVGTLLPQPWVIAVEGICGVLGVITIYVGARYQKRGSPNGS